METLLICKRSEPQRPESIYKDLREACLKQYSENNSLLNVLNNIHCEVCDDPTTKYTE